MTQYEIKLRKWLNTLQDILADVDKMCETKSEEYDEYHRNEIVPTEQGDTMLDNLIRLDNISDRLVEVINYIKVIQNSI